MMSDKQKAKHDHCLALNKIYHTKKIRQNLRMTEDRFVNREISSKMFGIYTGISKTEINGQNLDLFDVIRNVIWLVILVYSGVFWYMMVVYVYVVALQTWKIALHETRLWCVGYSDINSSSINTNMTYRV